MRIVRAVQVTHKQSDTASAGGIYIEISNTTQTTECVVICGFFSEFPDFDERHFVHGEDILQALGLAYKLLRTQLELKSNIFTIQWPDGSLMDEI